MVKVLLAAGADPGASTENGATPVTMAVVQGEQDMVRELVLANACVASCSFQGISVLAMAVYKCPAVIPTLLDVGADVSAPSSFPALE